MKLKQLLCMGALATTFQATAQSFERTMSQSNVDFNHYSVESTVSGAYILAGTKFRSGNNDIHIFKLDALGNTVWEIEIDISEDDRALDIAEDANGDIVVCGYIEALTPAGYTPRPYIVKLDGGGNFLASAQLDGFIYGACTNIIYSPVKNAYIVGGMHASNFSVPLTDNRGFICEVPLNLSSGAVWSTYFSGVNETNSCINDILEIPGQGFFIVGSFDFPGGNGSNRQAVLAYMLDFTGGPVHNLSFNSSNAAHEGISAVYIPADNRIYVMSNNTIVHSAQITIMENIAGVPFIGPSYYLELDPQYGPRNAAGFKVQESVSNPNNLVAAGYFKTFGFFGNPPTHTTPWLAEFDKNTGANVSTLLLNAPSANFYAHGGGVFSTFGGQQPYIFNQEILASRPDGNGYVFVGPRTVGSDYALDMVSTTMNSNGIDCMEPYSWNNFPMNSSLMTPVHDRDKLDVSNPMTLMSAVNTPSQPLCNVYFKTSGEEDKIWGQLDVYPNPTHGPVYVSLGENRTPDRIKIMSALGKVVLDREIDDMEKRSDIFVSMEHQAPGLYIIQVECEDGSVLNGRVLKE